MPRERDLTEEKWGREGKDERRRDSRRHSKESSEWREKRSHRDSRSRSPVHRKDRHKEGREEGRTRNGGYQDGRYYERHNGRSRGGIYHNTDRETPTYNGYSAGYGSASSLSDNYFQEPILLPRPSSYHHPVRTFPKKKTMPRGTVTYHLAEDEEVDSKPLPPPTDWLRRTPESDTRPEPLTRVSFLSTPRPLFGCRPLTLADGSPLPKNGGAPGHTLTAMERAEMDKQRQRKKEEEFKKDRQSRS